MSLTPLAVQKAILNAATVAVEPLGASVFDHVPHSKAYPFVSMDQHQTLENDASAIHGFTHNFYMSVWSDYRGQKQVWELMDAIRTVLHERRLSLETGGGLVLCRVTEQRTDRDADGLTYMGAMTVRAVSNPSL
jgi:hypothetical protein